MKNYVYSVMRSFVVLCLVTQLCPTLCNPMNCNPPDSFVHGDSPGKNTGVGYHALLQGIFPTQGWNPGLPNCTRSFYCLSHLGNSKSKEFEYDETLKLYLEAWSLCQFQSYLEISKAIFQDLNLAHAPP